MRTYLLLLSFTFTIVSKSQSVNQKFEKVDQYIFKIGALKNFNLATIADTITNSFDSKEMKSRAIFSWIAGNIALNPKTTRNNDPKNSEPETTIALRNASPLGMAKLFQEMASLVGIRCLIVDGFTKSKTENINNKEDETNASWNVVQLGPSPGEWYYVDVSKGCGFLDLRQTVFTSFFSPEYFFSDKFVFNLDHFAKNTSWILGEGPKSIKEFYGLPLINKGSYEFILKKADPSLGYLKAKLNTPFKFTLKFKDNNAVKDISINFGEGTKETLQDRINYEIKNDEIYFYYKFKKEDTTPFSIFVNGKKIITYLVEISE